MKVTRGAGDACVFGEPSPFSLERLSAFVDGDLPASELQSVRQHLEGCAACARRAAELGAVAGAARGLEVPEPPPTLWPAIEGALERPTFTDRWLSISKWRPFGLGAGVGLIVGAGAVAAVVLGWHVGAGAPEPRTTSAVPIVASAREPGAAGVPADPLLAEAEQEFARAAAVYERSIEKLRALLVREEVGWSPDRRARYIERLARLDEAIARSREAARRAPGDSDGNERLFAAYQQKIAFLTETVHRGGGWGPNGP